MAGLTAEVPANSVIGDRRPLPLELKEETPKKRKVSRQFHTPNASWKEEEVLVTVVDDEKQISTHRPSLDGKTRMASDRSR